MHGASAVFAEKRLEKWDARDTSIGGGLRWRATARSGFLGFLVPRPFTSRFARYSLHRHDRMSLILAVHLTSDRLRPPRIWDGRRRQEGGRLGTFPIRQARTR